MQPPCPLRVSRAGFWKPLVPGTAHLCAALPDGSAGLRPGHRGFRCAQTVFAERELRVPAEGLCGSAAAHACPSVVEERETFFSFGIVR